MCFPIDIELARDLHAERSRELEVENRLALTVRERAGRRGR